MDGKRKKTQMITARLVQHPFLRKPTLRLVVKIWEPRFLKQIYSKIPNLQAQMKKIAVANSNDTKIESNSQLSSVPILVDLRCC